jgi:beta-lactamase class C
MYGKFSTLPTLLAALVFGTAAQATDTLQSLVDTTIRPVMAEYDIAGTAVAISHNGQAHYFN